MRNALALAVVMVLFAAPAFAGDGNVPQGTLSALGLGDMQVVSDAEGMQVRGMASAFGMVKGTSLLFGQLMTPDTKNFIAFSSANEVDANAETTAVGTLSVDKDHAVGIPVTEPVTLDITFTEGSVTWTFTGSISGSVGGIGSVTATTP